MTVSLKEINRYIDHTLLSPDASAKDIENLCQQAIDHNFYSVCIHPCHLTLAKNLLAISFVKSCVVIGFPLGANTTKTKVFEAHEAQALGADEIDMVINIGHAKENKFDLVQEEIHQVVKALNKDVLVKTILETALLTDDQVVRACLAAKQAGASFVKTSTGFAKAGASLHHVALMRQTVGTIMGVKASGGIRSWNTVKDMIAVGASRIGASRSVEIMDEYHNARQA